MSRLIVKNLPPNVTEDKLLKTFSSHGLVTNVQLKYTREGKFRHFGFIGFKTDDDAKNAQKYFNGTFIGSSKISVEVCADLGDESKPRAWSKYAPDSSAFKAALAKDPEDKAETKEEDNKKSKKKKSDKTKEKKIAALMEKYKDDQKFQEFLRIHKRNSFEEWNLDAILNVGKEYEEKNTTNDDDDGDVTDDADKVNHNDVDEEAESGKIALKETVSDLDYLKSMMVKKASEEEEKDTEEQTDEKTSKREEKKKEKKEKERKNETYYDVKLSNLPFKTKVKDVRKFLKPLKPKSVRVPRQIHGIAYAGFSTEQERKNALKKSKSFLKDKQVIITVYEKKSAKGDKFKTWKDKEEELNQGETVAESGRIFIRNLSYTVTEDDIEGLFKPYGPLAEVNLPIEKITRKPKGFAFVTFVLPENAVTAFSKLTGTSFQGRLLHLLPGKSKDSDESESNSGNFKDQKAAKEKAQSGSSHNWNTLFLGQSVVADLVAEKYGVSKQDVLGGDGAQSAAVRLALGETQIVAETRAFLEENGVVLDTFSKPPSARSKTIILIKNLPAFTKIEAIRDMFAKYGDLHKVVLPPSGITAIVEFYEPSEARASFRKLAYSKFHGTPLYLEWAPENTFKEAPGPKPPKVEEVLSEVTKEEKQQEEKEEPTPVKPEPNSTIFVKNLNFDTTDLALREHFSKIGQICSATIATKKDFKHEGKLLSMGYGFVQFFKASCVDKALKLLQHKMLDGHCLELKRSNRASTADDVKTAKKENKEQSSEQASCKIICRNVPFEATEKEIRDIFKTFGTLKGVRLPKKITGSHRGFAFVEFLSKEEAKKAFQALCHSTHVYGRRLVLEWAAEEETIESLRQKTAQHFDGGLSAAKKFKKAEFMESLGVTPEEM